MIDSFSTYASYFSRASQDNIHTHPWYYYFKTLSFSIYGNNHIHTEAIVIALAIVGFVTAVKTPSLTSSNPNLLGFIAFYTAALAIFYSDKK